jgi:hypothetical protein
VSEKEIILMIYECKAGGGIRTAVLFVAGLAVAGAQTPPPAQRTIPVNADEGKRLSLGFVVGGSLTGGVKSVETSINTSTTDPPSVTDTVVDSKTARYLIGGAVRYDLGDRFGVGADVMYRRGGYDTAISISEQVTDDEDGDLLISTTEETRAHLIDIPILGRYYFKPRSSDGPRGFVTGGMALRFATGLSTVGEVTDQDLVTDTDLTPIGPENDVVAGVVLGAGIRAKDDVGVKVDIEARVTRWLNPVFRSGPANSNPNQVEVMVGLTF